MIDADEVLADHAQVVKQAKPTKRIAKRGAVTKRGKIKRTRSQRIAKACDARDPRCLL